MAAMDEALADAETFALQRGWISCPEWPFSTDFREFDDGLSEDFGVGRSFTFRDLFDHPFYFRLDEEKPIAIVSHLYDLDQEKLDDVKEYALTNGLIVTVDAAPRWWHHNATSVLWSRRSPDQRVAIADLPIELIRAIKSLYVDLDLHP